MQRRRLDLIGGSVVGSVAPGGKSGGARDAGTRGKNDKVDSRSKNDSKLFQDMFQKRISCDTLFCTAAVVWSSLFANKTDLLNL